MSIINPKVEYFSTYCTKTEPEFLATCHIDFLKTLCYNIDDKRKGGTVQ